MNHISEHSAHQPAQAFWRSPNTIRLADAQQLERLESLAGPIGLSAADLAGRCLAIMGDASQAYSVPLVSALFTPVPVAQQRQGSVLATAFTQTADRTSEAAPELWATAPEPRPIAWYAQLAALREVLAELADSAAEGGGGGRWTEPIGSSLQDCVVPPAWRVREAQESAAVLGLLTELTERADWAESMEPIRSMWRRWLQRSTQAKVADRRVLELQSDLRAALPGIKEVIAGRRSAADDGAEPSGLPQSVQPAAMIGGEPEIRHQCEELTDFLNQAGEPQDRPVADIDGVARAAGVTVGERMLATIPSGGSAPAGSSYSQVIGLGVLHRWADPAQAAEAIAGLLAPGGSAYLIEHVRLTGTGLIPASLRAGGFVNSAGNPVDTPMHDADTWADVLRGAGLRCALEPLGTLPAVAILATANGGEQTDAVGAASDRRADAGAEAADADPELVEAIRELWAAKLPKRPKDSSESFFDLGGDSLKATAFLAEVRERWGVRIPMRELFARPQLGAVAATLGEAIQREQEEFEGGEL